MARKHDVNRITLTDDFERRHRRTSEVLERCTQLAQIGLIEYLLKSEAVNGFHGGTRRVVGQPDKYHPTPIVQAKSFVANSR